jgi:hypothetical protein
MVAGMGALYGEGPSGWLPIGEVGYGCGQQPGPRARPRTPQEAWLAWAVRSVGLGCILHTECTHVHYICVCVFITLY